MRSVIRLSFEDVRPSPEDVLRRLGVPASVEPSVALRDLMAEAAFRTAESVEPRGVIAPIEAAEFAKVHDGEGMNAPEGPLDRIYPRSRRLALFVATIGERTEKEIAAMFRDGDPALACVLDAHASSAMERAVDALAARFAIDGERVLPYSPGFCGWHITGQRALFAALGAGEIGVTLAPSCLMSPIKSVSGVLIAGDAATHRFRPDFPFCEECETHDCIPRMASVR
ncbi:MAG TPA: hypothetical protein VGF40_09335 [Thermoanaerobaculia bacterium]